jgi:hypothetical protein
MFNNLIHSPITRHRSAIRRTFFPNNTINGNGNIIYETVVIPGPPGPPGPPGSPSPVPVTIANTSPYVALATDYDIVVTANAVIPASVVLPVSPTGTVFIIKDGSGVANINPITVSEIATTIDGAASAIINSPYGNLTFIYNGTEWNIV